MSGFNINIHIFLIYFYIIIFGYSYLSLSLSNHASLNRVYLDLNFIKKFVNLPDIFVQSSK